MPALQPDKRHYFKSVLFDHSSFELDFDRLGRLLADLDGYASMTADELAQQANLRITNTTQLQFEIVNGLVAIIDHRLPELRQNRMSARANQLIRLSFQEITGLSRPLDDDIKMALKGVKKKP